MNTSDRLHLTDDPTESRLRAALDGQARHDIPDRATPPPIDWAAIAPAPARSPRRAPWLVPLLAAAAVLGIAALLIGPVDIARRLNQPAGSTAPTATETVRTPDPSPSAGSVATDPATPPGTGVLPPTAPSPSGTGTAGTRVTLGRAAVLLPAGWTARAEQVSGSYRSWCLGPDGSCPVKFRELDPLFSGGSVVNPEVEGGYGIGDTAVCLTAGVPGQRDSKIVTDAELGGRAADYRVWLWTCGTKQVEVTQYTVVTLAPYLLYAPSSDASIREAMSTIAQGSQLPPATSSTRLYDQGRVTAAQASGDQVRVTIARTRGGDVAGWQPTAETATYTFSAASWLTSWGLSVDQLQGRAIWIATDGAKVTSVMFQR